MGSGKWEVGSGKSEVGSGKWEVGSGKSEVGKSKIGYLAGFFLTSYFHTSILLNMKLLTDILSHYLSIKQIDDTVCIIGIVGRVGYHYNGGSFIVQFFQ